MSLRPISELSADILMPSCSSGRCGRHNTFLIKLNLQQLRTSYHVPLNIWSCRNNKLSALSSNDMMQANALRTLIISKISRLGSMKSTLYRVASLENKVCKRVVLLIAFCLLFSCIPVAGSDLDSKDAKENVSISAAGRLFSVEINSEKPVTGTMVRKALKCTFEVQTSLLGGDAYGQSVHKPFSKPDQEHSKIDFKGMREIKQIHGAGLSDDNASNCDPDADASLKQDLVADAIRPARMKRLKKGHVLGFQHYTKVKRFRLTEEIERKTSHEKNQNVGSHWLIRVKPVEQIKDVQEEIYPQDHQRRALAFQSQRGMLKVKAGAKKASEQGSSRISSSHFGLGLSREQEQIHNVVAALRRSGLFAAIAGAIEGMNLFMLPQMTTIFVPTDSAYQALKQEDINFQLFQYHIVMQRYAFSQLCTLKERDILYTLLPGYSIIVTEVSNPFKIALDGVFLIAPDLYVDQSIAVHGIAGIFNCTIYGKMFGDWHVPEAPAPLPANVSDKQDPPRDSSGPGHSSINGSVSGAPAGGNNASVAGSEPGQHDPAQENADPNPFPFTFSPVASELASDTDASEDTISANTGACTAATAFFCVLLIL